MATGQGQMTDAALRVHIVTCSFVMVSTAAVNNSPEQRKRRPIWETTWKSEVTTTEQIFSKSATKHLRRTYIPFSCVKTADRFSLVDWYQSVPALPKKARNSKYLRNDKGLRLVEILENGMNIRLFVLCLSLVVHVTEKIRFSSYN